MTHESGPRNTFAAFRETLLAYTFDLSGLIAGFVIASQLGIFQMSPWAIAVYPAILSAKGVTHGLLSNRLRTALHLGTVYPRFSKNTKSFYQLISGIVVMTLLISIVTSALSLVFGYFFWGATFNDSLNIISVVVATMSLGLLLSFVTIKVAFVTFKRGLDPDIVVYPIMSTVADIFITLCFVVILNAFFVFAFIGKYAIATIILVHVILILYIIPKNFKERDFRRNLKESLLPMLLVSVIVNVTGTVLKSISYIVGESKEVYIVYPALIDMIGDTGSIVGSTATTKLALGLLRPSLLSIRYHAKTILSAWAASIVLFFILAFLSPAINGTLSLSTFVNLLYVLLIANVLAVLAIVLLSYGFSILTFQKGLDPDNFVNPIESSFADSLMTIALFVALVLVV